MTIRWNVLAVTILACATTLCAEARAPVPSAQAQQKGLALVRDVYKEEYTKADTPAEKEQLAAKMLQSLDSTDDLTNRYALLRVARDLSVQGGGPTCLYAVDEMTRIFEIDGLDMKAKVLAACSANAKTAEQGRAIAETGIDLINKAVAQDNFTLAQHLAAPTLSAARKTRDAKLTKQVILLNQRVGELKEVGAELKSALTILDTNPAEPAANLAVGRYYCLMKGNWDKGLSMLVLCGDPGLSALAEKEMRGIRGAMTPADQVALADGWWDLADQETGTAKDQLQAHAAGWYKRALPKLSGLHKTKVEKRLSEAPVVARSSEGATGEPIIVHLDKGATKAKLPVAAMPSYKSLRLEILGLEGGFPEPVYNPSNTVEPGGTTNIRFDGSGLPDFWLQLTFHARPTATVEVTPMIDYAMPNATARVFSTREALQVVQNLVAEQRRLQADLERIVGYRGRTSINAKLKPVNEKIAALKNLNQLYGNVKQQGGKIHYRLYAVADGKERTMAQSQRASPLQPTQDEQEGAFTALPRRPRPGMQPTQLSKEFSIDLGNGVKMEFVLIPAGEFVMGSPEAERQLALQQAKTYKDKWAIDRIPSEGPQHRVKISKSFYLGKYEVTQAQWEAVMGNNPSKYKAPSNPVEQVSWDDIQPFLAKLNLAHEKKGMQFGLPTEAQWEYACRAGTTTAFCFGDNPAMLARYGCFKDNSGGKTRPVGQGKPNAWGLYDMHGNVWEWCSDWYAKDFYAQSPPVDPTGPSTGSNRVFRGGGLRNPPEYCRSARRHGYSPGHRIDIWGFRVMCTRSEGSL